LSPRKRTEVVGELAKKYKLRLNLCPQKPGPKAKVLKDEEIDWLIELLNRGDISYITPGRKDQVYVGIKDGEKQFRQKGYLRWSLRDLLEIINGNHHTTLESTESFQQKFGYEISFSRFYEFLKGQKQYIFNHKIPQTSCLCEICENVVLLSKGINASVKLPLPSNTHSIVEEYSCNSHLKACMMGECEECKPEKMMDVGHVAGDADVKFLKWVREKKNIEKIETTITFDEAIKIWKTSVISLKQHIHRKRIQVFCLNSIKEELKRTEVLLHVDFSESCKNSNQDEIQSAYFGQSCFSIFTACAYTSYINDELVQTIPITVTTDSNEHSRVTSLSCIDKIISHIEEKVGSFSKLYVWSDGCASQFRSRFVFSFLSHFHLDKEIEWHFNEAHHGKGPMDGVGGTIKNKVFREVKSGRLTITTPEEFALAAARLVPKIVSLYLPIDGMLEEPSYVKDAPKIADTLKIHKVVRTIHKDVIPSLDFYYLSADPEPFHRQYYRKPQDRILCGHDESSTQDDNICALCSVNYDDSSDQEWLRCPSCSQWFHESCF